MYGESGEWKNQMLLSADDNSQSSQENKTTLALGAVHILRNNGWGGGSPILELLFRGQRTVTMFNVVHVLGFYMRLCGIGSVALGCRSCRSRQGGGGAGVGGKEPC